MEGGGMLDNGRYIVVPLLQLELEQGTINRYRASAQHEMKY